MEYAVEVTFAKEVIFLGADSEQQAKDKALSIIGEQYDKDTAMYASYSVIQGDL